MLTEQTPLNHIREEVTSKKVESVERWFRKETDHSYCRGEGAMVTEKGRKKR